LCTIAEIAELRFPHRQRIFGHHSVPVLKPEDARFRERAVIDLQSYSLLCERLERDPWLTCACVIKNGMTLAESAATAILARKPHRKAVEQQRAE